MKKTLLVAALTGVAIMVQSAAASNVDSETLYEGGNGWLVDHIQFTDFPETPDRNETGDVCQLQGRLTEGEENYFLITVAIENGALEIITSFNSAQYNLEKAPLGTASFDVDGTTFTGDARGRKHVVSINMKPQGFLRKLSEGLDVVATLPGVTPNTWSFGLEEIMDPLDVLATCVKEHMGKDVYTLL